MKKKARYLPTMATTPAGMAHAHDLEWGPLPSVLDARETDLLLQKLQAVHGEPGFDTAPELIGATRRQHLKTTKTRPSGAG
jgi:hypothetical protein